ncbi:MAG: thioesterase family protein [Rikenellaceae bacterium]
MIKSEIQIRFSDMDILNHVNNVVLQEYYDIGKSDYFTKVLNLPITWNERGFIAASTASSYLSEVHMTDKLMVTTKVQKLGTKSITIYQEIINTIDGEVKSFSTSILVAFDIKNHLSIVIPSSWRQDIENYEEIDKNE